MTATQLKLSALDTTITLAFSGAATLGTDYTASATQIVIPAGQLSGSIILTSQDDRFVEGNESFVVEIMGVTNGNQAGVPVVLTFEGQTSGYYSPLTTYGGLNWNVDVHCAQRKESREIVPSEPIAH